MSKKIIQIIILFLIPLLSIAANDASTVPAVPTGIGLVAENLMVPISVFSNFINATCFVIGGSFLFACLIKYIEHGRSPWMVPISTVVFLLIAGLTLILLPFLSLLSDNALNVALMK